MNNSNSWMIECLSDILTFARMNKLRQSTKAISDAIEIIAYEVAANNTEHDVSKTVLREDNVVKLNPIPRLRLRKKANARYN